MADIILMHSAK